MFTPQYIAYCDALGMTTTKRITRLQRRQQTPSISNAGNPTLMEVKFTAKTYDPSRVLGRYVRRDAIGDGYSWCETDRKTRYDLRQGTATADDLPDGVRRAADEQRKQYFGYVEWPLSE